MRKLISYIILSAIVASCSGRVIEKSLENGDIELIWEYSSEIADVSDDLVIVRKKDTSVLIFKSRSVLQDVKLVGDTIFIEHLKLNDFNFSHLVDEEIFGYKIKYKELSSHEVYKKWQESKEEGK